MFNTDTKVSRFLKVIFLILFFLSTQTGIALNAKEEKNDLLFSKLETYLNSHKSNNLKNIFSKDIITNFINKYNLFLNQFPNSKWKIKKTGLTENGKEIIEITITGELKKEAKIYSFKAVQVLAVNLISDKIMDFKIINEYSILREKGNNLPITIRIPNHVLTGSRYDIDIILDKPLKDSILAGGLIELDHDYMAQNKSQRIFLSPMAGGGLFKSVVADKNPGSQNWAAVLAHEDGLIYITKLVKIVSNSKQILYPYEP